MASGSRSSAAGSRIRDPQRLQMRSCLKSKTRRGESSKRVTPSWGSSKKDPKLQSRPIPWKMQVEEAKRSTGSLHPASSRPNPGAERRPESANHSSGSLLAPATAPAPAGRCDRRSPRARVPAATALSGWRPWRSGVRRRTRAGARGAGAGPEHVTAAPALRPPSPPLPACPALSAARRPPLLPLVPVPPCRSPSRRRSLSRGHYGKVGAPAGEAGRGADPRAAAILPCPEPGRWALPRSGPPRLEGLWRAGGRAGGSGPAATRTPRAGGRAGREEGGPPAAARVPPDGSRARAVGAAGSPRARVSEAGRGAVVRRRSRWQSRVKPPSRRTRYFASGCQWAVGRFAVAAGGWSLRLILFPYEEAAVAKMTLRKKKKIVEALTEIPKCCFFVFFFF